MKKLNKHFFSPNGHDPVTFERFCTISSSFDKTDLLDIIISNCNDEEIADITNVLLDRSYENGLSQHHTISVGVYYYIDEETGEKVFDEDSMREEFEEKFGNLK